MVTLENEVLKITLREHGAEMRSLTEKKDGTEYLWNGDPSWWKYSSPVLFPIVGKLHEGKYKVDGKVYELPSHGFGRISDFALLGNTETTAKFALDWSEETLKCYPYKFRLEISYKLENNAVAVGWRVINKDDRTIYFSIGAHPALRCPITAGEDIDDCFLEFEGEEKAEKFAVTDDAFLINEYVPGFKGKEQPLSWEFFAKGTWIFDKLASNKVTVRSKKSQKSVAVSAPGFPFWAFWSPEKGGAPFICIEPWFGHADFAGYDGEFARRHGTQSLEAGREFNAEYKIIICG